MTRKELQDRTRKFHVEIILLCNEFPRTPAGYETAKQLIRAAGSVGANYRATARAKSDADFHNKIKIVLEEADESLYWLEVFKEANLIMDNKVDDLLKEANELTAIFAATDKTIKSKNQK